MRSLRPNHGAARMRSLRRPNHGAARMRPLRRFMTLSLSTSVPGRPLSRYDLPAPVLPARIGGLVDVASNLAWSWNREARALFAAIDDRLWSRVRGNPIALLRLVD